MSLESITISDGSILVNIQGGPHHGKQLALDLLLLSMIVREVAQNPLCKTRPVTDEEYGQFLREYPVEALETGREELEMPTVAFLRELSKQIEENFGFCTPAIASALFSKLATMNALLKKSTESSQNSLTTTEQASSPDK